MKTKLIGYERKDFTLQDSGERITGCNVYISRPISNDVGKGQAVERVYISDRRAAENGIALAEMVGKDVEVRYNRYGKVRTIVLA